MDRKIMLESLMESTKIWDVIVIGGGASGLGTALESASRGYSTLLLERGDFAEGTSSRSTKLAHGGIRYLKQGELLLIYKALKERALLLKNAPHLVSKLPFIIPTKNWWTKSYYYIGVKFYDWLAGSKSFGSSHRLSEKEIFIQLPTLKHNEFTGGVCYFDGQFDDARFALNLAQTVVEQQGVVINYCEVQKLKKEEGKITGVIAHDLLNHRSYEVFGKVVVNATGIFTDSIQKMNEDKKDNSIVVSQGSHIILDRSFFPGDKAMIIPETTDGRVLFLIPWHEYVLIGTTDTPVEKIEKNPKPLQEEIDYLLSYSQKYLVREPNADDILGRFSGLRPLIKPKLIDRKTSVIPRDYEISRTDSNLINVVGGKWTFYRKMGEEAIDLVVKTVYLPKRESVTKNFPLHGYRLDQTRQEKWGYYGSDKEDVEKLALDRPEWLNQFHPNLPCRPVDVIWAVRYEMAMTLEDVLLRRTRCLLLNSQATLAIAPQVVALMAKELAKDEEWQQEQLAILRN